MAFGLTNKDRVSSSASTSTGSRGMNVMIPLGGIGSRFQKEGYLNPKPFVRVLGKEMILWVIDSLKLASTDTLVVIYNPRFLDMHAAMELVADAKPDVVRVELPRPTLGAAETVRFGLEALAASQRARPCVLVDGDTFYTCDIVEKYRAVVSTKHAGASFVFEDSQPKPMYSYVTIPGLQNKDRNDHAITTIVEKVKISDWANAGCYCFRDGAELLAYCARIIARGETQLSQDQKGEFYTSGVIKSMLDDGIPFEAIILERGDMHVLGTPRQVQDFCATWPTPPAYRVCFDLDNTLVSPPSTPGDYSTCAAVPRVVDFLRALHAAGHYIIIHTARRMRTHAGNVGAVLADVGAVTLRQLDEMGIPYHEIHFGKPWAQFYIDDHAVNALTDLDKALGFYPPFSDKRKAVRGKYTEPPAVNSARDKRRDHERALKSHLVFGALATYAAVLTLLVVKGKLH